MDKAKIISYIDKVLFLVGTEKRRVILLLPLYLLSSALELLGIGLLVAVIAALRNPESLNASIQGLPFYDLISIENPIYLLLASVLFVFVFKTAMAIYINKLTLQISFYHGAKLRAFLMGIYQRQSYEKFIQRNSADYVHNIKIMAGQFVSYTLQPILRIFSDGLVSMIIIIYLAIENTYVVLLILFLLSVTGFLYDKACRKKISLYGGQANVISSKIIQYVSEGLNAYRESHIYGILGFFQQAVAVSAKELANLRVKSQLITTSSRYILEMIVVTIIIVLIFVATVAGEDREQLLTTLAVFVVASTKLIPAANQIVTNISRLRYGNYAVKVLYQDIRDAGFTEQIDINQSFESSGVTRNTSDSQKPEFETLELKEVYFRYKDAGNWIIDSADFKIQKNDIVGIYGESGSGKSTILSLMLGFLKPSQGSILFNGKPLGEGVSVREWHDKIAYLPQEPFMTDDTLARNIALGLEEQEIDSAKLDYAIKKAKLDEMIKNKEHGIHTPIGEKGYQISGGQRQRVTLARAFYFGSEVLILDESTSALDSETENEIIKELNQLKGNMTIVLITHEQALLKMCTKVFKMGDGKPTLVEGK